MRVIKKKISLEAFKSRMPSLIPAYDDNGVQHEFAHLSPSFQEPLTNYGMIPFNVKIDEILGENEDVHGSYDEKWYTYSELCDLFHKLDAKATQNKPCSFTDKVKIKSNLLTKVEENVYKWLLNYCFPYFIFTNDNTITDEIQATWGTNRLSFQDVVFWRGEMQRLSASTNCCETQEYEKRGGDDMLDKLSKWYDAKIGTLICDDVTVGHDCVYNVSDDDTNIEVKVLKIIINSDGTQTSAITTHSFSIHQPNQNVLGNNRYITYGTVLQINEQCNISNPYDIEIIDGKLTIPCLVTNDKHHLIVSEPYFNVFFTLNNTFNDMGEMSPICEEWQRGYDYSENNTSSHTVVYYNNDNWILRGGRNKGYIYSTTFQETYFGTDSGMTEEEFINYSDNKSSDILDATQNTNQWQRYMDYFGTEVISYAQTYAYKNNQLIINPNADIMSQEYDIDTNHSNGFYVESEINKSYRLFTTNIVELPTKVLGLTQIYEIKHESYSNIPYITYNGQTKKATLSGQTHVFAFKRGCETDIYPIEKKICYRKNGRLNMMDDSDNKVDGIYVCDDGYEMWFKKNENGVFVCSNQRETDKFVDNLSIEGHTFQGYSIQGEIIKVAKPYIIYDSKKISGYTTSDLTGLYYPFYNVIDNLGNKIEGLLPYNSNMSTYIFNPQMGDWLGIPYIPNYIANEEKINDTTYWCNYLHKLSFHIEDKIEVCTNENELKDIEERLHSYDEVTCDIEYYGGTIVSDDGQNNYSLVYENNDGESYYGIKYVDTVILKRKEVAYYVDTMNKCLLFYWDINFTKQTYHNEDYDVNVDAEKTYFEYRIKPFKIEYGYIDNNGSSPTFIKVNPFDNFIAYKGNNYQIEYDGSQKYFSVLVCDNQMIKQESTYYKQMSDGKRFYYVYNDEKQTFEVTFPQRYANSEANINEQGTYYITIDNDKIDNDVYERFDLLTKIILNETCNGQKELYDEYFDYSHEMTISPLFRKEYNLGKSSMENVVSDIYIDRGTAHAIDFHLRLLESKSLESLEQIGNGFFNIIDNK